MHPIPYLSPIFREIFKLKKNSIVFFLDKLGLEKHYNPYFKVFLTGNNYMIKGYKNYFIKNFSKSVITGFFSRINFDVYNIIKKKENTHILINGYQTFSSWLILFFSIIYKKKIIFKGETIRIKRNFFKNLLIRIFFYKINFFLYSCSGNLNFYKSISVNQKKLINVPCCIDYEFFLRYKKKFISKREKIRRKLGFKKNTIIILFVSKFIDRKNPNELIQAIKDINNKNIELLFVGGGPKENDMRDECRNNKIRSKFISFLSQEKLGEVYLISDLYVNTSYYDASPKTLNEALCFDIPIIAPKKNIGQVDDIVINGKNGFKYEPGNLRQLTYVINQSLGLKKKIIHKTNSTLIAKTHPRIGALNLVNKINL